MITCAPMPASSTAVSLPIPLLPPVMTATLPSSRVHASVRSFAALGLRSSPGCAFTQSISSSRWKRISRPPGKAVGRDAVFAHHAPQVLDVHVQQLGRHRGREDRREAARA